MTVTPSFVGAARRLVSLPLPLPLSQLSVLLLSVLAVAAASCGTDESTTDAANVVDRLNSYWADIDQGFGFTYQPVPADRITTGDDGITCNGVAVRAEEIEGNAFVDAGCEEGILVAYDPDYVNVNLARLEGTLSHEWGHVIQAQATELDLSLDPAGLPIDAELQADCFSGAWAGTEATAAPDALRRDLAEAGDPGDIELDAAEAHGTAAERLIAFNLGFDRGPDACFSDLVEQLPD